MDFKATPPLPQEYRTYGRRRGRGWSETAEAFFQKNYPIVALNLPLEGTLIDPKSFFSHAPSEIWMEMGLGYGEHIRHLATSTSHGLIGAEIYQTGLLMLLKSLDSMPSNLKLHWGDGRQLLDRLAPESIDTFALLFPDPWRKKRHEKRQTMGAEFVQNLYRILKPGGLFRFASDAPAYVEKVKLCMDVPQFQCEDQWVTPLRPPLDTWAQTRYEQKALADGRACTYLHYRKR